MARARKATRDEALVRAAHYQQQADVLTMALQAVMTREAIFLATIKHDGWTIRASACRLSAPHGGVLILQSHFPGQRDSVAAYYAEDWLATWDRIVHAVDETVAYGPLLTELRRQQYIALHPAA